MPRSKQPQPGLAYLCGLLHDIGFLVLNLFFRNEHDWLNKMLSANPEKSILEMEQRLLGASHTEIGNWLMQAWNMPVEICVTVAQHHNLGYAGPCSEYALLVNLSERLLKMHGMSDSDTDDIPAELLAKLGLDEEQVFEITDEVLQGGETLKEMAVGVCA
jgi:HD-like signal output (HDOD) protein